LFKDEIKLTDVNFISPELEIENKELKVRARVRYRQPLFDAVLYKLSAGSYKLVFEKPQKFIAPGQSAVLYTNDSKMLGGGIITC